MKKMNYEEFIETQTEIIEKATEVDVEVSYKDIRIAGFFGKFDSVKRTNTGFNIELENDDFIKMPPESQIEVYEGDETKGTTAEYIILSEELRIYIGIMAD